MLVGLPKGMLRWFAFYGVGEPGIYSTLVTLTFVPSSRQTLVDHGMVVDNCSSSSQDPLNKSYFIIMRVIDTELC